MEYLLLQEISFDTPSNLYREVVLSRLEDIFLEDFIPVIFTCESLYP